MSRQRRIQIKYITYALVPVVLMMLMVGMFVSMGSATTASERQYIGNKLDAYLASQPATPGDTSGESGVVIMGGSAAPTANGTLHKRVDSTDDGIVLGEGDNAANSPIIVDAFTGTTVFIPGTSERINAANMADSANVDLIRNEVIKHRRAGLSTDIVVYCLTGHIQSPPVMALGALSQAHAFDSSDPGGTIPPKVYGLKWGRLGWGGNTSAPAYSSTFPTATNLMTPAATALPAAPADCPDTGGTPETVRCRAAVALATATGSSLATASSSSLTNTQLAIDVRPTLAALTPVWAQTTGATKTLNLPLSTLFSDDGSGTFANLKNLDNSKTNWFTADSQHLPGMAAEGALMMGFTTSKIKIERWGNPAWNNTLPTQFSLAGRGYDYPFLTSATNGSTELIDVTGPTLASGPTVSAITETSATVSWTTNEPSTSVVNTGTSTAALNGPASTPVTVLSTSHSATVSGLSPGTKYYFRATSYDGMANGGYLPEIGSNTAYCTTAGPGDPLCPTGTEGYASFTTVAPDTTAPVITNILPSGILNTSTLTFPKIISADYSDTGGSGVDVSSVMVHLDVGNMLMDCPTQTASHVECNASASDLTVGTHSIDVQVYDNAGNGGFTGHGSVTIVDDKSPVVTYTGPGTTGTSTPVNNHNFTIAGTYSDAAPSSGIASAQASLDNGSTWTIACTAASGNINCPASVGSDQTVTAKIKVTDNGGNIGYSNGAQLLIDTGPPTSNDDAPAGWQASNVTFNLSCTDAFTGCATTSYSLNGGAVQSGDSSFPNTIPILVNTEGDNTLEYWSVDRANNTESPHKSVHVKIDKTAPVALPSGLSDSWVQTDPVTVGLGCSDFNGANGSGCDVVPTHHSTDGGATWQTGSSFDISGEGDHTVLYYATDAAGNNQSTQTGHVKIDHTAPATTDDAPGGWQGSAVTVHLNCTDTLSGCASNTWSGDNGLGTGSGSTIVVSNAGTTTILYHSVDAAGNVEGDRTEYVNIDKTAPTMGDDAPGAVWQKANFDVHISCTDTQSGCAYIGWTDNAAPGSGNTVTINTEGDHYIIYQGKDLAGNYTGFTGVHAMLDKSAPSIFLKTPTGTSGSTSQNINFQYSDAFSGVDSSKVTAKLDTVDMTGCTVGAAQFSCNVTGLGYGIHTVDVSVTDNAGNTTPDSWTFTISANAPVIDNWNPKGTTTDANPWLDMTYHSSGTIDGASIDYTLVGGGSFNCTATIFSNQTYARCNQASLADGTYNVHGQVWAGTEIATKDWPFTKDTTAPVTTDNAPAAWQSGDVNITLACSDATTSCASTSWSTNHGESGTGNALVTTEGDNILTYHSVDTAGNAETDKTAHVKIDKTAPVTTDDAPADWHTPAFTVTLTCADQTGLSGCTSTQFKLDGAAGWTTGNQVLITTDGDHTIVYRSTDAAGNTEIGKTVHAKLDTVAPVTTPDVTPGWHATNFTVNLPCSDSGSGCKITYYRVDDVGDTVPWSTGNSLDITAEGDHTIQYFSVDNAGSTESVKSVQAKLDKSSPTISANAKNADNTPYTAGTWTNQDVTVHFTCGDTGGSGLAGGCPADITRSATAASTSGSVNDNAGNTNSADFGQINIDKSAPTISNVTPTGWINTHTPVIEFDVTDFGAGVDPSTLSSSLVDISTSNCTHAGTPDAYHFSCPVIAPGWAYGSFGIAFNIKDAAGNTATYSVPSNPGQFSIDTYSPDAINLSPTGQVGSSNVTLSADLGETGPDGARSGVDPSKTEIHLDGSATALTDCPVRTASKISCNASVALGDHHFSVKVVDNAGNMSTNDLGAFSFSKLNYYFTWYDNNSAWDMNGDWIMASNLGSNPADVKIFIGDISDGATPVATFNNVPAGEQISWKSDSVITGGPVRVESSNGQELLVSQRVLYKDSFNEIFAADESSVQETENYFTWYDNNPAWGMNQNWIMVANVGNTAASADVFINGAKVTTLNIPAGGYSDWVSPTPLTAGPVKIVSQPGDRLVVSQRVLYKDSFNEVLSVGKTKLDTEAYFTWYDNNPAWGMNKNYVLVTNVGSATTNADILLDDLGPGATPVATLHDIAPGQSKVWESPTPVWDGPLRVLSPTTQTLLVSQRVIYKDSFEEVQGTSPNDMGASVDFNWYDMTASTGMMGDWILVGNETAASKTVGIDIGGSAMLNNKTATTSFDVAVHDTITPLFNDKMDGPVHVGCSNCSGSDKLIISQRVIYKNSFNELVGKPRK